MMYFSHPKNTRPPAELKKGFTLIELLVVISIIGMLSSVVLAGLQSAREKGKFGAAQRFDSSTYHALGADAVAIWNMDVDGSDSSGNGNTLTLSGASISTSDKVMGNGSLYFNTSRNSDKATVASIKKDGGLYDFKQGTISIWVETKGVYSTECGFCQIIHIGNGSRIIGIFANFAGAIGGTQYSGKFPVVTGYFVNNGNTALTSNLSYSNNINKWVHVAISFSGSSLYLYVNGTLYGSETFTSSNTNNCNSGCEVLIGNQNIIPGGNQTTSLRGYIDEVRIYSQSMTSAQVEKLYAEGLPRHMLAEK